MIDNAITIMPEALSLYHAVGFEPCPAFGGYPEGPPSVFMEKRLTATD